MIAITRVTASVTSQALKNTAAPPANANVKTISSGA